MFISIHLPVAIVYVGWIVFVFMERNGKAFAFTSVDIANLLKSEKNNL